MSGTPEVPDFLLEELGNQAPGLEENGESELNDDVARLTRWWLQEEAAPELLPFQTQTVEDLYAVVEEQQGFVDVSKTSVAEASSALLYQMEIDRVKYLLSRYLRARLRKLEKYILHVALDPDMRQRLSPQELRFAGQYLDLVDRHAHSMVLDLLPEGFQSLTQEAHGERPVDAPDLDRFVFCRVLQDCYNVQVDDSAEAGSNVAGVQDLIAGDVHVLKYRVIRPLVGSEAVELI